MRLDLGCQGRQNDVGLSGYFFQRGVKLCKSGAAMRGVFLGNCSSKLLSIFVLH